MYARASEAHRLIRNLDTGLYLCADGRWVAGKEDAFDFPDLRTALTTYEQMEHRRLEMVMVFENGPTVRPQLLR